MSRNIAAALCSILALLAFGSTGCIRPTMGPMLPIPIPVTPYFQDKKEDEAWAHERYERVPILGPITAGGPAVALDAPSDDEVMVAFEKARPIEGGIPLLHEVQRNNVRICKEKIADYVDPPRFVPMIGPAQLHHAHYKCTIYYDETVWVGWPIPYSYRDEDAAEVIYIDHNHFHMVGNVDPGVCSHY
ncbi:MAG: hypothetical protein ACYC6N_10435 [Pirellulaceae bacterium]